MAAAALLFTRDPDFVSVPRDAFDHAGFRRWITSPDFPEKLHATFAEQELIIDMSPESIDAHNQVKGAITVVLGKIVLDEDLGQFYQDGALLTHEAAGLSTEPDFMFASWRTLESDRLRQVPKSKDDPDSIELAGTPDVVVEVVSRSSVRKDTVLLRAAYARAGVPEYWIIDARGEVVRFEILALSADGSYAPASASGSAQRSHVLGRSFRLGRTRNRLGRWLYRLHVEP